VTYGSYGCEIKPNKEEKHRTQLTTGGDRIHYPDTVGTPTADMTLVKVLLNSIHRNRKCAMHHPRRERLLPEHTDEEV
jgi:hypothetical protein